MLKSAVERQFEIIGEAPTKLAKIDQETATLISAYRRIMVFRNILIHGYAQIDDRLVWGILDTKLPTLLPEVKQLLEEETPKGLRLQQARLRQQNACHSFVTARTKNVAGL